MKKITSILILFIVVATFVVAPLFAENVKIGVLAKRGPVKCLQKWQATADYLSSAIEGQTFEIVPLAFDAVNPAIENEEVDFFLINSSMFVVAKVKYGASAVATMENARQGNALQQFGGVIFTSSENEDINNLADLKGKTFMAVKKSSFGGWQMAYKELKDAGIMPSDFEELSFAGSHDNVVLAVDNGDVAAGTVRTDTLERMADEGVIDMEDFKIIAQKEYADFPFVTSTVLYPEWPLAKVKSTDDGLVKSVVDALKSLSSDSPASQSAKIMGWVSPLDYSAVEDLQKTLKVGAYSEKGKKKAEIAKPKKKKIVVEAKKEVAAEVKEVAKVAEVKTPVMPQS